jgi:hypothetical protein
MTVVLLSTLAFGSEGMWLPEQVPDIASAWTDKGLAIDPETLADPLSKPLGAIVTTGGCSAAFVSDEGLIATNHHCVERWLQQLSDEKSDRFLEGYRAPTREDELSVGPGAKVWVVQAITDVTDAVLDGVGKKTDDVDRERIIDRNEKKVVAECEAARENRRCWIDAFDGGGSYRLVDALELQDIRMVYAEPISVGQFGGEIDNWMWPRQAADFAFVRAYVAPDGSSAPYSEDNVPFEPPHHLEVSTEGVKPGDFVMVAGYPGRTSRRVQAADLQFQAETYLPASSELTRAIADTLISFAEADPEAAKRVGPSISGLENGWKNAQGTLEGLRRGGLIDAKVADEAAMRGWVGQSKKRKKQYGKMLAELDARGETLRAERMQTLTARWVMFSADLLGAAHGAIRWATERQKDDDLARDAGYQDRDRPRREARLRRMDASLHLPSDRAVFQMLLERHADLPADQQIAPLAKWLEEHGGIETSLDTLYASTALTDADARVALLDMDLDALRKSDDPWIDLAFAMEEWQSVERESAKRRSGEALRLRPVWYDLLKAWHAEQGRPFSQDANSSLRLTFGTVQGYHPEDGLWAEPQTTLSGVVRKAGPAPFDVPESLLEDAKAAADSRWADPKLGDVPVNFLADLDITGGNSGSSVLDGQGRWVGLAFDSNWESVAADWVYEDATNRCISVDLRYVFWLLDRNEAGKRVLAELGVD